MTENHGAVQIGKLNERRKEDERYEHTTAALRKCRNSVHRDLL